MSETYVFDREELKKKDSKIYSFGIPYQDLREDGTIEFKFRLSFFLPYPLIQNPRTRTQHNLMY